MLLFFECALCFLAILPFALTLDPSDIVITILSQKEGYHSAQANFLKKSILESADALQKDHPHVVLSHEIDDEEISRGSWTFYPLIPMLATKYADSQWYVFCLENTAIRLEKLLTTLAAFNSSSDMWLGHVLRDKERTIIHHFRDTKKSLKYPNLVSGFAISQSLMKTLNERLANEGFPVDQFSIDAPHEFALYIYNDGNGTRLTHSTAFCVVPRRKCATYPKLFYRCGDPVSTDKIFFAVKTFDENHGTRIPILQQTWLKLTKHHALFSNKEDPNLKDIVVVADTKKGHCLKTFEMLEYANKIAEEKGFDWIVVTDDDTIISIARLSRLLSCYNPNDSVAIGERYGFYARDFSGYDYLTGGAGLVLSASLVNEIVTSETCRCPTPTTPDDMYLFGNCLQKLGYPPIHSIMFHQARPNDYADKLLASQEPLSFHQFWVIDPIKVYVLWFADDDDGFESHPLHPEL